MGGVIWNKHKDWAERHIGILTIAAIATYIAAFLVNGNHLSYRGLYITAGSLASQWHEILANFIFAASGSVATLGVCHLLCRISSRCASLSAYGRYTLGVYILQTLLVEHVLADTVSGQYGNAFMLNVVIAPLGSIAATAACIVLIRLMSRSKWLDKAFFGGAYSK